MLDLPAGAVPVEQGGVTVAQADLIEEPDTLGDHYAMAAFFERQTRLTEALAQPEVAATWQMPDGTRQEAVLQIRLRTLGDLPGAFWFQQGVGILALLVGGWVLALRGRMPGAAMFGLTSLFVPVFALSASVYSTRFIALDGDLFRILSSINHFGAVGFGAALVGLFLMYPRPLVRAGWLWVVFGAYGALYIADKMWVSPMVLTPLLVMSQMLGAIVIAIVQWVRARRQPLDRARAEVVFPDLAGRVFAVHRAVGDAARVGTVGSGAVATGLCVRVFQPHAYRSGAGCDALAGV